MICLVAIGSNSNDVMTCYSMVPQPRQAYNIWLVTKWNVARADVYFMQSFHLGIYINIFLTKKGLWSVFNAWSQHFHQCSTLEENATISVQRQENATISVETLTFFLFTLKSFSLYIQSYLICALKSFSLHKEFLVF